jgi:hypothetical protein
VDNEIRLISDGDGLAVVGVVSALIEIANV